MSDISVESYSIPKVIPQHIFRAYDIRGVVDDELTADMVFSVGLALGSEAISRGVTTMVCARDGRLSGPVLFAALKSGLLATGVSLIDIGVATTPMLYFAAHIFKTFSGVMLTGSHNPANFNGIKMMLAGQTLSEADIQALYQRIVDQNFVRGEGDLEQRDVLTQYVDRVVADIKLAKPLKVVIDCGNGVSGVVAPTLFRALGCEVVDLFTEIDGHFPNHHPDPTQYENVKDCVAAVKQHDADLGLAFDGDGDRLGVVTRDGELIYPDRQMILFAQDVLSRNPGSPIIFDVKCSKHLADSIQAFGGEPIMHKTGHSLIKAKMQETGAPLAGEMSGHIFFKERWYGFDDGLYAAARLLEILSQKSQSPTEIFKQLPNSINTPEIKLAMADEKKFIFVEQLQQQVSFPDAIVNKIDGLRVDFNDGWGLVRPSNTTPCLVLRFEADNKTALDRIMQLFKKEISALDSSLDLSVIAY